MTDWQGKKVTILGLGRTGYATAVYLANQKAKVLVSEASELKGANLTYEQELDKLGVRTEAGEHSNDALERADLIITSPGIRPNAPVIVQAQKLGKEVISDVELAFREAASPVVAVTGTNGKSTTTALISFILEHNGKSAPACGNIGVPVLQALSNSPDYLIIEVSSYQLYYCRQFAPQVAIWLNLTPDHLDWHGNLEAYIEAKQKLFAKQTKDQFAVLNMDDKIVASTKTKAKIFPFSLQSNLPNQPEAAYMCEENLYYRFKGQEHMVCSAAQMQIIGRHNWENALAAIAATCVLGLDKTQIADGLTKFKALEHRLEYVDTIDGVPCYNDSKATNTDSAIKALQSFKEKIVLIAGGRDKGTDLKDFVNCVRNHAAAVILLGEAKERFYKAFQEGGVKNLYSAHSLEEAVVLGVKLKAGPVVLSPACASFDMFRDFEDRGNVFKDIVRSRCAKVATSHS